MSETIYALASAPGRAGIAVYRLSGPQSSKVLAAITGLDLPKPRLATRCSVVDPINGEKIDDGLVLWFPAPRSYTGDDVVELHLHGGTAVRQRIFEILDRFYGLQMAEPGEFTRRAVLAGKIDFTEAEGLIDLIDAETDAQRRQALLQSRGVLGDLYNSWRDKLLPCLAHLEAAIDFPDEDLPEGVELAIGPTVKTLIQEIENHLEDGHRGERLRDGLKIAIFGPPNVGKSSLLNWLARRDAAIVSETAGTTRDVIEVHLDLGGFPVVLADTAGIRDAQSDVESIGIERTFQRAAESDLKIVVAAADQTSTPIHDIDIIDSETILVLNKIDLLEPDTDQITAGFGDFGENLYPVSVTHEAGLEKLVECLIKEVEKRLNTGTSPTITRHRHRRALRKCLDALKRARSQENSELCAEDLRLAVRFLGNLTGSVDVEDLLDIIFLDFCIGK
ncbi:MAG: tRNA uridine-5-carboxymethylaminomethyl(34) synthesis GTPase MnmE [Rhodospirillaceae bacterium]|nr:tRNA uridine-5-carboxymethylaminomethyl(34) synthesis GTPase MnmE [Rhodospirillaceae bacterium]